jgi:hypothetical protein
MPANFSNMNPEQPKKNNLTGPGHPIKPETDSDHSGSDCDNDKTEPGVKHDEKFDKPKREVDPDTTGTDTESDKTKK